jgi:predicted nucleic acid-binding protein
VVVVDTDAFSKVFIRQPRSAEAHADMAALKLRLQGRIVVVATQTRAELKAWPLLKGWGAAQRARLDEILSSTSTVPVTEDVVDAFVTLTVRCQRTGHALAQKDHVADRWVAASAMAIDRPLLTLDGVYQGAPDLALLP